MVWRLQIRGQVFRTWKYTDDLVLPAKEETVLQGMFDSTSEIGKCYEMEMNWKKKNKVTRISRQPSPIQITIDINN